MYVYVPLSLINNQVPRRWESNQINSVSFPPFEYKINQYKYNQCLQMKKILERKCKVNLCGK